MHWFGRGDFLVVVCTYGLLTTRADKEFYSAHRASYRYGTQCALHTRLTASRLLNNIHFPILHLIYDILLIIYNFSFSAECLRVRYGLLIPCTSLAV